MILIQSVMPQRESHSLSCRSLSPVEQTFLIPLWARAAWSKVDPRFTDPLAEKILAQVDFDFDQVRSAMGAFGLANLGVRAVRMDQIVREFAKRNPNGIVVNLGCGLDTLRERLGESVLDVFSVDLPDAIEFRKRFTEPSNNNQLIESSILDTQWKRKIPTERPTLVLLAGVSMYLTEAQLQTLIQSLRGLGTSVELAIDAMSPWTVSISNCLMRFSKLPQAPLSFGTNRANVMLGWIPGMKLLRCDRLLNTLPKELKLSLGDRLQAKIGSLLFPERLFHFKLPNDSASDE